MEENKMNPEIQEEEFDSTEAQIRECLKRNLSSEVYETWIENFVFEEISEECVTVSYYGTEPLKIFNKNYKDSVWIHICSVIGYTKKFKVTAKKSVPAKEVNVSVKKNIKTVKLLAISLVFVALAFAIGLVTLNYISNRNFRENFYSVSSLKNDDSIRVVQISDLHSCVYGKNNKKLISRVEKLSPDIILLTGDIIDAQTRKEERAVSLCAALSKIAPSYYIYGNNEAELVYDFALSRDEIDKKFGFTEKNRDPSALRNYKDNLEAKLEKSGVKVLKNEMDTITVGTTVIDIYGVLTSNPSAFYLYADESYKNYINENPTNLKIMAIHEPFIFEEIKGEFFGDLLVCGHTHGGSIRIPVLGPLYTNEGGILPERNDCYVYGRYNYEGMPLIVSSGMENRNVFRINNEPELVVIDVNKF